MLAVGMGSTQASAESAPFAAQIASGHLTKAQTAALKAEVDHYLKVTGGRQAALNKIDIPGGEVLVAIPGEAHPRDFAGGNGMAAAVDHCLDPDQAINNGWFCAYPEDVFQGTAVQWYACGTYPMNFVTHNGSWSNNQTRGRQARMYGKSGNLLYTTPGAYSSDAHGNWWSVWKVKPC
ncbi:hypothetical protein [Streptomyces sp. NPDC057557]|uniref:hypothetical protein n=1 Tax=Streptomyces sp. NPDC057557 TaxID=3346167 RepID=UPI0036935C6B